MVEMHSVFTQARALVSSRSRMGSLDSYFSRMQVINRTARRHQSVRSFLHYGMGEHY